MIGTEVLKADLVRSEIGGIVLAQPDLPGGEAPGGGQGPGFGKSSPVGLFLVIVLLVAVAVLVRSMTKHLKKVSTSFDQDRATAAAPARVRRAEAARAEAAQRGDDSAEESDAAQGDGDVPDEAHGVPLTGEAARDADAPDSGSTRNGRT